MRPPPPAFYFQILKWSKNNRKYRETNSYVFWVNTLITCVNIFFNQNVFLPTTPIPLHYPTPREQFLNPAPYMCNEKLSYYNDTVYHHNIMNYHHKNMKNHYNLMIVFSLFLWGFLLQLKNFSLQYPCKIGVIVWWTNAPLLKKT